ncbi:hypothetical protein XI06_24875 [Bradyrhizobium sp. CCBAU 11434]|nr:hypothetical protein [Bradyrhizobium sp. CCBAU 11434]
MGAESHYFHPARALASARRIVVKIGSDLIVDRATGATRERWLEMLVHDIARYWRRGLDIALVSSGAVAIGRHALDLQCGKLSGKERRAAAAIGQMKLARAHREIFARHGLTTAQLLLALEDTTERRRMRNLRVTMNGLLTLRAVPVLNENDAIGAEPSFSDNDQLAARVAKLVASDTLVLLSNVSGLYSADPHEMPNATLIREVQEVTPEIELMAGRFRSDQGTGGMVTKLAAARLALASGFNMIIADGRRAHPLSAIEAGEPCTWFRPPATARASRKTWIAGTMKPTGTLMVDSASTTRLRLGGGLRLGGLISFEGDFSRGDAVILQDLRRREIARGLSVYSSSELRRMAQLSGTPGRSVCREPDKIVDSEDLALTE